MAAVLASIIAVLGTLGGVTATYLFQGRISACKDSEARDERLRQERLTACSAFAGAVMDLRGIQYTRGFSRLDDAADRTGIRAEGSQLRSIAWSAFYRFRLSSPDDELTRLAMHAVDRTIDVADCSDKTDLRKRSEQARACIDEFINAAGVRLTHVIADTNLPSV